MPRRDPTPERHGWSHEAHARRRPSWQVRLSILASGVGALLAVAFIVVGVPWLLIRFVGNPLPSAMPDLDTITWSLRNGQIPNRFWIGALALVVWVVWAQLTVALLMETAAVIRSVEAPMLPTFGFAGSIATQLVGAVVLLSVVATAVPAEVSALSAAPLSSGPSPTPAAQTTIVEQPVAEATAPMPLLRVDIERRATLRSLASEYLGDAERWGEIRDHNVGAVMGDGTVLPAGFTRISAGWQLEIPGVADVLGTWTVQEGDHFWRIATETLEAAYGRAPSNEETTHYWQEIVTLNDPQVRSGDPDLIHPGERFDVTLPPIPAAGLAADAPLVASDFTLSGLLPENVFEPAEALPSEPAPTGSDAGLRWSVPGSVADAAACRQSMRTGALRSPRRRAAEWWPRSRPLRPAATARVAGRCRTHALRRGPVRRLLRRRRSRWRRRSRRGSGPPDLWPARLGSVSSPTALLVPCGDGANSNGHDVWKVASPRRHRAKRFS